MKNLDRWRQRSPETREGQLLRRLELVLCPDDDRFELVRFGGGSTGQVRLVFKDRGDLPEVQGIYNYSLVAGWGSRLVSVLHAMYPDTQTWAVTPIHDPGVVFWMKVQERLGITLVDKNGVAPLVDPEYAAALLQSVADMEALAPGHTRMRRTSALPKLEGVLL